MDSEIPYVILGALTMYDDSGRILICLSCYSQGHSERRTLFHESSKVVAQKTRAALDKGLSIILCIGETLNEREAGETAKVCEEQLKAVVEVLKESDWR